MRRRRLALETLESRTVLSTGSLASTDLAPVKTDASDVVFTLELTDEAGELLSSLETGQRFYLSVLVQDTRADAQGVFAGALDLVFDASLVVLDGAISFGPAFPYGNGANWTQAGLLDEIVGFGGMTPSGANRLVFARVPFIAVAPGMASFAADPADYLPMNEVLVYGWDYGVPAARIRFDGVLIDISGDPCGTTVTAAPVSLPERPAPIPESVDTPGHDTEYDDAIPDPPVPNAPGAAADPVEPVLVDVPEPPAVPTTEPVSHPWRDREQIDVVLDPLDVSVPRAASQDSDHANDAPAALDDGRVAGALEEWELLWWSNFWGRQLASMWDGAYPACGQLRLVQPNVQVVPTYALVTPPTSARPTSRVDESCAASSPTAIAGEPASDAQLITVGPSVVTPSPNLPDAEVSRDTRRTDKPSTLESMVDAITELPKSTLQ